MKSNLGSYIDLVKDAFNSGGPQKYIRSIEHKGAVKGGVIVGSLTFIGSKILKIPVVHKKCAQVMQYAKKLTSHADHEKQEINESEPPTEE